MRVVLTIVGWVAAVVVVWVAALVVLSLIVLQPSTRRESAERDAYGRASGEQETAQ